METHGDFITALVRCDDRAAVGEAVKTELGRFGYSSSICVSHQASLRGNKSELLFRNWTADWLQYSSEQNFSERSFALPEARRRSSPFTWTQAARERHFTPDEREVLRGAHDYGWKDGLIVPIHGPNGYLGFFSMATAERDIDASTETNQRLAMVGYLAHQRCVALAPAGRPLPKITGRERECLRWVAAGKTDREIGVILSLSSHTVKMHVDSARRRLGASTRSQAAAQLALTGRL